MVSRRAFLAGSAAGALSLLAGAVAGDARPRKPHHSHRPSATPGPTRTAMATMSVAPTVVPASAAASLPIYGPGIAGDGKDNRIIGHPDLQVAHRWRSAGGVLAGYSFNQRFGPDGSGYSNGTGGTIELALFACGADGLPTGSAISTKTFNPTNPHTQAEDRSEIPWTPTVPAGLVCVTHRNVDADPNANFMSANEFWIPAAGGIDSPRQPAFPDDSLAVLSKNEFSAVWSLKDNNTPVFDARFADGRHEGQAFYERYVSPQEIVLATADKVRERFTPTQVIRAKAVWLRVNRQSGSTLNVDLAGVSASTDMSWVPVEQFLAGVWAGGRWVRVLIAAGENRLVLPAGVEQTAVFSTDGQIRVAPIREPDPGVWGSRGFMDGIAEKSIGGGAWTAMYAFGEADLQMYIEQ